MSTSGAERYGNYYMCVKVTKALSSRGEVCLFADEVEITPHGDLVFWRVKDDEKTGQRVRVFVNLIVPAGQWLAHYAASIIDGGAVAVEHWDNEVLERVTPKPQPKPQPVRRARG